MEEMIAVNKALSRIATVQFWLGGKYNSTSGKYYWVGSGVDADLAASRNNGRNYNLALFAGFNNIQSYQSRFTFPAVCEEY